MVRTRSSRFRLSSTALWVTIAFVAIVALAGGSARGTVFGQVYVRIAASLAATVSLLLVSERYDARLRPAFAFLGACAGLICLQLVPLPPSWWRALPQHDVYATVAMIAGSPDRWRPISVAPDLTWDALFSLLVPAALLVCLMRLTSLQRAGLMLPLVILIFVSGVLGLAQVTGGPQSALRWYDGPPEPSATGFLSNRNHQALLLACGLPVLAALASTPMSRSGLRKGLPWAVVGVAAFILLMLPTTGSRAGLVLGAGAILLAIGIALPTARSGLAKLRRRHRRRIVLGAVGATLAFSAVFAFFGRNIAFSRVNSLDLFEDQRVLALPVVIDILKAFFPVGAGIGTFDPVFRYFEPHSLLKMTYFNEAHNDLIQIVLEGGALAMALFVIFAIWWIAATLRAWRAPASAQASAARAGSAIVLLCILASVVDYPLRTPLMLSLFCLASVWMLTPEPTRERGDATD